MALADQYNFEDLVNESERLVLDELEQQISAVELDEPIAEDLILDIAALALNRVQPRYRVNLLGRLYAQHITDEESTVIRTAVAEAIDKVLGGG